MVNVAEVLLSPEFLIDVVVERRSGQWGEDGRYTSTIETLAIPGNIQPAGETDTVDTPEGVRVQGDIAVYTLSEVNITKDLEESAGVSDTVIHAGERYQCIKAEDWSLYGYWKTICTRE